MNGCAFCTILHVNDARDAGESDDRLTAVAVWRDVPWFSERERIALEWTERLTDLAHSEIDDEFYERALKEFGERGLVDLTLAVATINAWNRLNVPFRVPPDPKFRSKAVHAMSQ
jgi:alkylhydroperoxidase family enzyme